MSETIKQECLGTGRQNGKAGKKMTEMEVWKQLRNRLYDMENQDVIIVSHRGRFSSSVIENTSLALCLALQEGADMVELDLDRTRDGVLVGHHDRTLHRLFHDGGSIGDYSLEELRRMPLYNYVGEICEETIETFEEILQVMQGRTCLVLDKCWDYWDEVYRQLTKAQMREQAVFKFYIQDNKAYEWAMAHSDCTYVPMVREMKYLEKVLSLKEKVPVPALEILPQKETDLIYQKETLAWLKDRQIKVWCNSLSLAKRLVYGAGNDDLKSLRQGGRFGWGRLVEQGVDIIQTDWPYELKQYLLARQQEMQQILTMR